MIQTRSLRWLLIGVSVCLVIGASLLIISGTIVASGQLWDVDGASDIQIGSQQEQVITNIEVFSSNKPVRVHVGDLVGAGANMSRSSTSYRINSENSENRSSGVYVENPNSPNATVVISASAIPNSRRFDLHLSDIDTTNVSRYNRKGSEINRNILYTAQQGKGRADVKFSISSPSTVEFEPGPSNKSTRFVRYNYSINQDLRQNTSITIWEQKQNGEIGQKIKTISSLDSPIHINNTTLVGKTRVTIGLHSSPNEHGLDSIYNLDTTTLNISEPIQFEGEPLYYNNLNGEYNNNSVLAFELNSNISEVQGRITVDFSVNKTAQIRFDDHPQRYDVDGEFLYVYPLIRSNFTSHSVLPQIDNIRISRIATESNVSLVENRSMSEVRLDKLVTTTGKYTANRGSKIGLRLKREGGYKISKENGNVTKEIHTNNSDTIHTISTNNLTSGYYYLTSESGSENITIQLNNSTTRVNASDSMVGSQIPIRIRATGNERSALLTVLRSHSEKVYQEELNLIGSSNTNRSVPVAQPGTYIVKIHDLTAGKTASQEVTVSENKKADLRLSKTNYNIAGNTVELTVNSTFNQSSVDLVGQNTTTTLNLTTTDTGPTSISINTYASPASPAEFVTTGSGIAVDSVSGDLSPLSPGTYNLTLRSEHGTAVTNDSARVTVEPRSTTDLAAYTTRAVSPDGFENATAVREAISDGTLTPATTATENDTVVYAANATGLTGFTAATNASVDRGADLDRLDGLSFGVAPVETSGSGAADSALGPAPNASEVHLDRRGLFFVTDGATAFGTRTPPAPGETFEATFRVDDERLRRAAGDDRHRVTTRLISDGVAPSAERADNETQRVASAPSPADNGSTESGPSDRSDASGGSGTSAVSSGVPAGSGSASDSAGTGSDDASGPAGRTGSAGGTGSGGGPVGGGGPPGRDTPSELGNATDGDTPAPSGRSSDPGANLSTAPPGSGVTAGPNGSEAPAFAGPPGFPGTGRTDLSASSSAAGGADASEERPDGRSDGDDARSTGSAASTSSPAERDSSSGGATATDLGYEEAPIRSTAYDLPGFGAVPSLAALTGASLLARRRVRAA